MGILSACVYVYCMYMPGTHGDRKKAQDPLTLGLRTVVSCHVGAGNLNAENPVS